MQQISLEEARMRIPDSNRLYQALQRYSFMMPPRKDAINSNKFLKGVQSRKYWVPKTEDVQIVK